MPLSLKFCADVIRIPFTCRSEEVNFGLIGVTLIPSSYRRGVEVEESSRFWLVVAGRCFLFIQFRSLTTLFFGAVEDSLELAVPLDISRGTRLPLRPSRGDASPQAL